MKFITVAISSLFAAVSVNALPQEASAVEASPSYTSALSPQASCLAGCAASDVMCQAACTGAARPNEEQANATTQCAMQCDQGSGSPEDTAAYADCQQACIASLFPSTQTFSVDNGAAASGAVNSVVTSAGSVVASVTEAANSAVSSGASAVSNALNSAQASSTGAASNIKMTSSTAGFAGLLMAIFAF